MSQSITELISLEHIRLKKILLEFEEIKEEDLEEAKKVLSKFRWNLEKHFFLEEKAIFSLFEKIKGEQVSEIFDLMQEHGVMINLVKELEDEISENKIPNANKLKEHLLSHEKIEDENLYPMMDEELNNQQKQETINRIKEIIE